MIALCKLQESVILANDADRRERAKHIEAHAQIAECAADKSVFFCLAGMGYLWPANHRHSEMALDDNDIHIDFDSKMRQRVDLIQNIGKEGPGYDALSARKIKADKVMGSVGVFTKRDRHVSSASDDRCGKCSNIAWRDVRKVGIQEHDVVADCGAKS